MLGVVSLGYSSRGARPKTLEPTLFTVILA